jgi:hypothetical protein
MDTGSTMKIRGDAAEYLKELGMTVRLPAPCACAIRTKATSAFAAGARLPAKKQRARERVRTRFPARYRTQRQKHFCAAIAASTTRAYVRT